MTTGHVLRRTAVAGVALAAAGTASASAGAAVIATDAPCYRPNDPMVVAGQGFAPGAPVQVESSGLSAAPTTDAAGNFQVSTTAPVLPFPTPGVRSFTLNATDGTTTAATTFRVTSFAAAHTPRSPPRPQTIVRWRVAGLQAGGRVYAHYVHGGRQQRRVSFGRMPATCGVLSKRLAMIPIAHPAPGRWRIQIDQRKRYSPRTQAKFVESGTVTRRIVG